MSTRSLIWQEQGDGSFKGIYCHHDGYIKGVGETLLKYYANYDRLTRLINLGGLSSLGMYIEPLQEGCHMRFDFSNFTQRFEFDNIHTFDDPQEDVCVAYHRDRGEELEILSEPNLKGVIEGAEHTWAEYIYIFRTNKWYVIDLSKGYELEDLGEVWRKIKDNEKN